MNMNEKLTALLHDTETAELVNELLNDEEAMDFFRERGVEVSSAKELREMMNASARELSLDELESMTGGSYSLITDESIRQRRGAHRRFTCCYYHGTDIGGRFAM